MANPIHPGKDRTEVSALDPPLNRVWRNTNTAELRPCDPAELLRSERSDANLGITVLVLRIGLPKVGPR
jgi:hypothetical protein